MVFLGVVIGGGLGVKKRHMGLRELFLGGTAFPSRENRLASRSGRAQQVGTCIGGCPSFDTSGLPSPGHVA